LVTANGIALPPVPASSSWTPSCRAAVSLISTMIASTSTCGRRVSSWRITCPSWRCTSFGAAMTSALAPSKRVTTAVLLPKMLWPVAAPPPVEAAAGVGDG
jgi:hypothetical protein